MLRSRSLHLRLFFALAIAAGCASSNSRLRSPATSPLGLQRIEVREQGTTRTLASDQRLQAEQSFGLTLSSDVPLYLYVLLEHVDSRRELFHPRPGSTPLPVSGAQRLPASGDWFRLHQVEPG